MELEIAGKVKKDFGASSGKVNLSLPFMSYEVPLFVDVSSGIGRDYFCSLDFHANRYRFTWKVGKEHKENVFCSMVQ